MNKVGKGLKAPGRTWRRIRPGLIFALVVLVIMSMIVIMGISWLDEPAPTSQASSSGQLSEEGGVAAAQEPDGSQAAEGQAGTAAGTNGGADAGASGSGTVESAATGEDFSQDSPTQRYVSETQRHQNFLAAVAEGKVLQMDFTSTDYQPVVDPNTSYITFSLTSTDGTRSSGTMVMKFEDGMWRISAVKQLGGDLGGGTNYLVPASFESDLKADLANNQPFFTKLAEGRVGVLIVDEVVKPSDSETDLYGRVVGRSGRYEETQMHLSKDYSLWHLTTFDYR
jgi:hypothetical protein